jgi:hypothetical protein
MKTRTALRAGGSGCSPETQYYMEKALAMEAKVENCTRNSNYYPYYPTYPTYPTTPSTVPAAPSTAGFVYPDRSGWCG